MRSRYTAYVRRDYAHLERSLSVAERGDFNLENARGWAEAADWQGLTIHETTGGTEADTEGTVTFSARYAMNGQPQEHVETARFIREDGRWAYAGQVDTRAEPVRRASPKVGRNDPCPCGSGKKYKKCCGAAA